MEEQKPKNLAICQDCGENPAVYGDGVSWSRCSACQLKATQKEKAEEAAKNPSEGKVDPPKEPEGPEAPSEKFEHKIVEGIVSIIIPVYMNNYTLFHYTGNCLGAVREHTPEDAYEIVIVDNGSPVQPPELNSYYAHRVIKNEANLGVTKAWNQGIRTSVGEYIVLLNNDVQVFEGWLEDMKKALDTGEADLVMAHPMYSLTEPFARAVEAKKVREGKKKLDNLEKDFSCVMFKRSLVDEIGLFDEVFFSYCSDIDFIRRMEEKGKKIKMMNQVATSHISDATGYAMPETAEIMNKDKAAYKEKWDKVDAVVSPAMEKLRSGEVKLIRTPESGDAVYFVKNGEYHHVSNPDTLHALGYELGQEVSIPMKELAEMAKDGEPISMDNVKNYV